MSQSLEEQIKDQVATQELANQEQGESNLENLEESQIEAHDSKAETYADPKDQLKNLEEKYAQQQGEIESLQAGITQTQEDIQRLREEMGLPPIDEVSISATKDLEKIEELTLKNEEIEKEKEALEMMFGDKDPLEEMRSEVLEDRVSGVFEEFAEMEPGTLSQVVENAIANPASTERFVTEALGSINLNTLRVLAEAFLENTEPNMAELLKTDPEMFDDLEEGIEEEIKVAATEKVEEVIAAEKAEVLEEETLGGSAPDTKSDLGTPNQAGSTMASQSDLPVAGQTPGQDSNTPSS